MPEIISPGFDCPLVPYHTSFSIASSTPSLAGLTTETCRILDDVRFLTVSITNDTKDPVPALKIRSTASWLYDRLCQTSPPPLPSHELSKEEKEQLQIEQAVRLAAKLYSRAISSITMLSATPTRSVQDDLYAATMSVSLTRWKAIPGIFLWIMLVLCPGTKNDLRGRFIRRKMAVTGLSIGFEDFRMGIPYLRGFWLVQRWIVRQREEAEEADREGGKRREEGASGV
jgi:hypothetical protein